MLRRCSPCVCGAGDGGVILRCPDPIPPETRRSWRSVRRSRGSLRRVDGLRTRRRYHVLVRRDGVCENRFLHCVCSTFLDLRDHRRDSDRRRSRRLLRWRRHRRRGHVVGLVRHDRRRHSRRRQRHRGRRQGRVVGTRGRGQCERGRSRTDGDCQRLARTAPSSPHVSSPR